MSETRTLGKLASQEFGSSAAGCHHDNNSEVHVYDWADVIVPMLARMYKKRLAGYSALGLYGSRGCAELMRRLQREPYVEESKAHRCKL